MSKPSKLFHVSTQALLIGFFVLSSLLYVSFYTVYEGQSSLRLRLGKIVDQSSTGKAEIALPGLHFRLPLLDQIYRFDMRLQSFDVQSSRILTKQQKYVLVDYFVKWRINDIPLYYTRTGGFGIQARQLLQQKINDTLRAAFGQRTITEVVTEDRGDVMALLKKETSMSAKNLGIDVIDVRIKRIDLPEEVSLSVFERMRTERERVATRHRSDGKAAAEVVRAKADAEVTVMMAEAKKQAAAIRAEGIAKAAAIYSKAYQNDSQFYAFYRSLEAYRRMFRPGNDVFVLSPHGALFRYFHNEQNGTKK